MIESFRHIFSLGCKEIIGLFRDPLMVVLIIYSFSFNIYMGAKSAPEAISMPPLPSWTRTARP